MQWNNFHYLTEDRFDYSHGELAARAAACGVRWIQFRSKNLDGEQLRSAAISVQQVCREFGVTFVINDYVDLAFALGADGVHLGQGDSSIAMARKILGSTAIIGGTANNPVEVRELIEANATYIGIGPFRHTATKKNLAPVLGISGVSELVTVAAGRVPLVAIGGIMPGDVPQIVATGVTGIAACSAAHVIDSEEPLKLFLDSVGEESQRAMHC